MTAIAGYAGSVKIGSNAVLEIDKWDLTVDSDVYDTSSFPNTWKTEIPGMRKWSGSFSGRQYQGDTTGQALIQAGLLGGTSIALALYTDATHNYSGTAWIKQIQVKTAVSATVDVSVSFEGSGTLTYI